MQSTKSIANGVRVIESSVAAKAERIQSSIDGKLWPSPLYFALVLLIASIEWFLRKRWQLK